MRIGIVGAAFVRPGRGADPRTGAHAQQNLSSQGPEAAVGPGENRLLVRGRKAGSSGLSGARAIRGLHPLRGRLLLRAPWGLCFNTRILGDTFRPKLLRKGNVSRCQ